MPQVARTPVRTRAELARARTISVADYAVLFNISEASVYKGIRSGDISSVRVGNVIRIPAQVVRRQLGVEAEEW
jgi:excisionase family DNA binding protein